MNPISTRQLLTIFLSILTINVTPIAYSDSPFSPATSWQRDYGWYYEEHAITLQNTSDGGYIIAGNTLSEEDNGFDPFLIKVDSEGNEEWKNIFQGSSINERSQFVHQTEDGGYLLFCDAKVLALQDDDGEDTIVSSGLYLIKTDSQGKRIWIKELGGSYSSVLPVQDESYIIVGDSLRKIDCEGNVLWTRDFDYFDSSYGTTIRQSIDGGYIIIGTQENALGDKDIRVVKTNAQGYLLSSKFYGGNGVDVGNDIRQTHDGGFILLGTRTHENLHTYLVRINAKGDTIWSKIISRSGVKLAGTEIFLDDERGYTVVCQNIVSQTLELGGTHTLAQTSTDLYRLWSIMGWDGRRDKDFFKLFFYQIDLNGETIDTFIVDNFEYAMKPFNIINSDDGDYVISYTQSQRYEHFNAHLRKIKLPSQESSVSANETSSSPQDYTSSVRFTKIIKIYESKTEVEYSNSLPLGSSYFRLWKCNNFTEGERNTWELLASWKTEFHDSSAYLFFEEGRLFQQSVVPINIVKLMHPVDENRFYEKRRCEFFTSGRARSGYVLQLAADIGQYPEAYNGPLPFYGETGTGSYTRVKIIDEMDPGTFELMELESEPIPDEETPLPSRRAHYFQVAPR